MRSLWERGRLARGLPKMYSSTAPESISLTAQQLLANYQNARAALLPLFKKFLHFAFFNKIAPSMQTRSNQWQMTDDSFFLSL